MFDEILACYPVRDAKAISSPPRAHEIFLLSLTSAPIQDQTRWPSSTARRMIVVPLSTKLMLIRIVSAHLLTE